jgi:hypothetical protein
MSLPVPKVQDRDLGQERGWREDLLIEEDHQGRYRGISLTSFRLAEACFLVGSALTTIVLQQQQQQQQQAILFHLDVPHSLR